MNRRRIYVGPDNSLPIHWQKFSLAPIHLAFILISLRLNWMKQKVFCFVVVSAVFLSYICIFCCCCKSVDRLSKLRNYVLRINIFNTLVFVLTIIWMGASCVFGCAVVATYMYICCFCFCCCFYVSICVVQFNIK